MYKIQFTERSCKRHCKAHELTLFDRGLMLLWWSPWLRIFPFFWLFSDIFTFIWLHCTSVNTHGGSYSSILINLVPDQLRWQMELDLVSDWLYCFVTSHPAFIVARFWDFYRFFLYFWPPGFKTVVIVNRRKANRRKPSATCLTLTPNRRKPSATCFTLTIFV